MVQSHVGENFESFKGHRALDTHVKSTLIGLLGFVDLSQKSASLADLTESESAERIILSREDDLINSYHHDVL
jgi:hypothetical protein